MSYGGGTDQTGRTIRPRTGSKRPSHMLDAAWQLMTPAARRQYEIDLGARRANLRDRIAARQEESRILKGDPSVPALALPAG